MDQSFFKECDKMDAKKYILSILNLILNLANNDELIFYDNISCNAIVKGFIPNLKIDNITEFKVKFDDIIIHYVRSMNCWIEYDNDEYSLMDLSNRDTEIVNVLLDYVFNTLTLDDIEFTYNEFYD